MRAMMGFGAFTSTSGRAVKGNLCGAHLSARLRRPEYRQMLNKKGIYDVPLTKQDVEERRRAALDDGR